MPRSRLRTEKRSDPNLPISVSHETCPIQREIRRYERVGTRKRLATDSPQWIVLCFLHGMFGLGLTQLWPRASRYPKSRPGTLAKIPCGPRTMRPVPTS
jgi:hypothetical protein